MKVRGRDLLLGIPKMFEIGSAEVSEAIVKTVKIALVQTPPELANNIVDHGIFVTRGGALLKNIDRL